MEYKDYSDNNRKNKVIEIDCQCKDVEDTFPFDGELALVRFTYKKGITFYAESMQVGDVVDDLMYARYANMDYMLQGVLDYLPIKSIKSFKKGDTFIFKQHNKPSSVLPDGTKVDFSKFNNSVERILLFFK